WSHEKEWRILTGERGPRHYVDSALSRVYLGCKISDSHEKMVCDILNNRPTEILKGRINESSLEFTTIKHATPLAESERVGAGKFDPNEDIWISESDLKNFLRVQPEELVKKLQLLKINPNVEEINCG